MKVKESSWKGMTVQFRVEVLRELNLDTRLASRNWDKIDKEYREVLESGEKAKPRQYLPDAAEESVPENPSIVRDWSKLRDWEVAELARKGYEEATREGARREAVRASDRELAKRAEKEWKKDQDSYTKQTQKANRGSRLDIPKEIEATAQTRTHKGKDGAIFHKEYSYRTKSGKKITVKAHWEKKGTGTGKGAGMGRSR